MKLPYAFQRIQELERTTEALSHQVADLSTTVTRLRKIISDLPGAKRFTRPSVAEIRAYASEHMLDLDPETFHDYYESTGWTVGRNKPMKDWKAAARRWSRNPIRRPQKPVDGTPRTAKDWQRWCGQAGLGPGPRGYSEEQFVQWAQKKYKEMSNA